jgi:hypothetical protein
LRSIICIQSFTLGEMSHDDGDASKHLHSLEGR